MADFSGASIGERISIYRKLNRLTMEELAERTDNIIRRDVIANIESGRRKDITVYQLVLISKALRVPPTALMFDVTRPLDRVEGPQILTAQSISNGVESTSFRSPTLIEIIDWYSFQWSNILGSQPSVSGDLVMQQVDAWRHYLISHNKLARRLERYENASQFEAESDKATRIETGSEILQAWSTYREALDLGVTGIPEPPVAEAIGLAFLEGSARAVDREDIERLLGALDGSADG